jgi:hypothetical protein
LIWVHTHKWRIVVHSRIADQDLYRAIGKYTAQRLLRRLSVSHIETYGLR